MSKTIALCGAASCGKTTTAYKLRNVLIEDHVVEIVHEYAREYLLEHKRGDSVFAQVLIFLEQLEREITIMGRSEIDLAICECPLFLNYLYTLSMRSMIEEDEGYPVSRFLSKIYQKCINQLFRYDHVFYLSSVNTEFKDDAIRGEAKKYRCKVDLAVKGFLDVHIIDYITVDCPKEERANMILDHLGDKL